MISQEEYNLLTKDARADVLWKQGTFLEEVIDYGKFRIMIYELNKFFVGVFYCVKENKIDKIEVLTTGIDKLLKEISPN